MIHRDLKPGNILVTSDGTAKVSDFGLARAVESSTRAYNTNAAGTFAYMAPEQWDEDTQVRDPRCDLFSLGATLYDLLVGEPPFVGEDFYDIADMAVSGEYKLPSARVANLPPGLETWLIG